MTANQVVPAGRLSRAPTRQSSAGTGRPVWRDPDPRDREFAEAALNAAGERR